MTRIFLSYSSEDRAKARLLAEALSSVGVTAWWDRSLVAGERFATVIQEQLALAHCVVVLWSKASIESDWVIDEASEGKRRRILVPVSLDRCTPPLGFRQIHTGSLAGWDGSSNAPEFVDLTKAVRRTLDRSSPCSSLGQSSPHAAEAEEPPPPSKSVRRDQSARTASANPILRYSLTAAAGLVVAALSAWLLWSRLQTPASQPELAQPASAPTTPLASETQSTPTPELTNAASSPPVASPAQRTLMVAAPLEQSRPDLASLIGAIDASKSKSEKIALKLEARKLVADRVNFGRVAYMRTSDNERTSMVLSFESYDPAQNILVLTQDARTNANWYPLDLEKSNLCPSDQLCRKSKATVRIYLNRVDRIDVDKDGTYLLCRGANHLPQSQRCVQYSLHASDCGTRACTPEAIEDGLWLGGDEQQRIKSLRQALIDVLYKIDGRPAK